jgi:uncharacterized protein YqgC (DUF456 family)
MTAEPIIGLSLALVVMRWGLIGSIVPGLRGTPLILGAAIAHRLYFGAASANNQVLAGLVGLALLSFAFDYLARRGASYALGGIEGGFRCAVSQFRWARTIILPSVSRERLG